MATPADATPIDATLTDEAPDSETLERLGT